MGYTELGLCFSYRNRAMFNEYGRCMQAAKIRFLK